MTDHQALFLSWKLSARAAGASFDRIAGSLGSASVDLNPHQIEAALFALQSPLARGALLADEVGLGKTIEAGIVIAQLWAEGKRKILLIVPASIRKQWVAELQEKFGLRAAILDSLSFKAHRENGCDNPFIADETILVVSYQFAAGKGAELTEASFDLVLFDEAHRLRNVFKRKNKISQRLRSVLSRTNKLLLTATPLQNSLLELYGLMTFVDPMVCGCEKSFREHFVNSNDPARFEELKRRIQPHCFRTLRRQVSEYIRYTKRGCLTEFFEPYEDEAILYEMVSAWLSEKRLNSFPKGHKGLVSLIIRKVMASSSFALSGTFDRLLRRLEERKRRGLSEDDLMTDLEDDLDELRSDYEDWDEKVFESDEDGPSLEEEIEILKDLRARALAITRNAKGDRLASALSKGFMEIEKLGAPRKALIFTESRRTQRYLYDVLENSLYRGSVVLFNGQNDDPMSVEIYRRWLERNKEVGCITGNRSADTRAAIIDHFRDSATIMIATEAAAEGVNLQFCSLVVNYDLPWNPQRIEQRIGRCHRYGQRYDVTVLNFVNSLNRADQRVYELLAQKFHLFDGVFGASDEVLGNVQSGVDFERRILGIYQSCRTSEAIDEAFDTLKRELEPQITAALATARAKVMDRLDAEVHERLKLREKEVTAVLTRRERELLLLTGHILGDHAIHVVDEQSFQLDYPPDGLDVEAGLYRIGGPSVHSEHRYDLHHPLAQHCLFKGRALKVADGATLHFLYSGHPKVTQVEARLGNKGWLVVSLLSAAAKAQSEEVLVLTAVTDEGETLSEEEATKLLSCEAFLGKGIVTCPVAVLENHEDSIQSALRDMKVRNHGYFAEEIDKVDLWALDLKNVLEHDLSEVDRKIDDAKRASALSERLEDRLTYQKAVRSLERQRDEKRKKVWEGKDEIDAKRDQLIAAMEDALSITETARRLFVVRFSLEKAPVG